MHISLRDSILHHNLFGSLRPKKAQGTDRSFSREAWVWCILVGLFSLSLYVSRLSPTVYTGDSGDFILAAAKLGLPHPPGFPFYTLIGHLFTYLPFGFSVAWKVNLTSAVFEAATVSVVFLVIYFWTRRLVVAFFGATLLAFSFTFFFYAEFAEVFALNNFLVSCSLLFALLFQKHRKVLFAYFFAFFFGLSFSHHQTSILFLPLFGVLLWNARSIIFKPKILLFLFALFMLPFLFYLYPLLSHLANPPIIWHEPRGFSDLIRLFFRADYGTFQSTASGIFRPVQSRFLQIPLYFQFFILDFGYIGLSLLALGFTKLFLHSKALAAGLFSSFALSGFLFLVYANFPLSGTFEILVIERFILLSFILAVITMSFGVLFVSQEGVLVIARILKIKKIAPLLMQIVPLVFLLIPLTVLVTNFLKIDLSNKYLGKTLIEDLLSPVERESIVFLRADTVVLNSAYLHFVENYRADLKLITGHLSIDWFYNETLPHNYPGLAYPKTDSKSERFEAFIKENAKKYQIYYYVPPAQVDGFVWVPEGLLHKLYPKDKVPRVASVKEENREIWQRFRIPVGSLGYKDLMTDFSVDLYSEGQVALGNYFFLSRAYLEAKEAYIKAVEISASSRSAHSNLGFTHLLLGECQEALQEFFLVLASDKTNPRVEQGILQTYRECLKDDKKAKEFEATREASGSKLFKAPFSDLEKF